MQNTNQNYIEKVQKLQERLFVNRSTLANMLGVDKAQLTRWIDGKGIPNEESKQKIDKLYNQLCNLTQSKSVSS